MTFVSDTHLSNKTTATNELIIASLTIDFLTKNNITKVRVISGCSPSAILEQRSLRVLDVILSVAKREECSKENIFLQKLSTLREFCVDASTET